ncbi:MAG TPA: hypothetical protein VGX23_01205 [Actinocrinis sp.]|nr:hypothetical protein [Actinocrinis sp.]
MSDPATGQGGPRPTAARRPTPERQPKQPIARQAQKSTLGLTPMTAKPGRPQPGGRPPVPAPAPPQDVRTPGGRGRAPGEPPRPPTGLAAWIRRRRTRAHLGYLPKWTARRPEPFGIGGLHWLPMPATENRGPAIVLHGGESMLLALAEMSPGALRGPESANLGARLAAVLTTFAAQAPADPGSGGGLLARLRPARRDPDDIDQVGAPKRSAAAASGPGAVAGAPSPGAPGSVAGPASPYQRAMGLTNAYRPSLARIQVLHQVPGSAGRTRSYVVLGFTYDQTLVEQAARLGQGERGLTLLVSRAAETVFAALSDPGPRGGRVGTLVPLDRPAWTRLLGALILPGRGDLVVPQSVAPAWRPTEIDALAPRYIAVTAPIGTAGQTSTWWHATGWVKRWPHGIGTLDLAACAGFLPPGVTGTASVVLGLRRGEDRTAMPTVAGYLTVSGRDAVEVELARVAAHAAADARDGFVEFCDRSHHLAFADTLPLARGLAR